MKFLTLLLTSMLIVVASAQMYTYMYIQGNITFGASRLIWEEGPGASDLESFIINGMTVSLTLNLSGYGAPVNFTDVLYLTNEYNGAVNNIYINVTEAVGGADFTEAKMHIWTNATGSWQYLDYVNLETLDDYYTNSMAEANDGWLMTFEIDAVDDSLSDPDFTIAVRY